jgi:hypothetical protein
MLGPPKARRGARPVPASLEAPVPQDHFYRHLAKVLDLAFVRDLVRDKYAPVGRPSLDPVVFFQLQLTLSSDASARAGPPPESRAVVT